MPDQHWGVCIGDEETGWEIKAVYKSYDYAIQEAMMWTHETQAQHVVKPVKPRKEVSYEIEY